MRSILILIALLFLQVASYAQEVDSAIQYASTNRSSMYAVTSDARGNIFVAGYFTDSVFLQGKYPLKGSTSNSALYIASFTRGGKYRFGKLIYTGLTAPIQLETDANGNLYLGSYFEGTTYLDGIGVNGKIVSGTGQQAFIVEMDSMGVYKWHVNTRGAGVGANVKRMRYSPAPDGSIYWMIAAKGDLQIGFSNGQSNSPQTLGKPTTGRNSTLVMRTHPNHNKAIKSYGVIGTSESIVEGGDIRWVGGQLIISTSISGNVDFDPGSAQKLVSGNTTAVICAWDTTMAFTWVTKTSLENLVLLDQDSKGQIRAFGNSGGIGTAGLEWCILDTDGNILSELKESFSSGYFELSDLSRDHGGNIFLAGTYSGSGDFDPSAGYRGASFGLKGPFLAKYDPQNALEWLVTGIVVTTTGNAGSGVHLGPQNDLYWCGTYSRQLSFSGLGNVKMPSTTRTLGFLAYLRECKNFTPRINPRDTAICLGESVYLSVSGADSFVWADGTPGSTGRTVNPVKETTYFATAGDGKGCSSTLSSKIRVQKLPEPKLSLQDSTCTVSGSWASIKWFIDGVAQNGQNKNELALNASGRIYCLVEDTVGCASWSDMINYFHAGLNPSTNLSGFSIRSSGRSLSFAGPTLHSIDHARILTLNGLEHFRIEQPETGRQYALPYSLAQGIYLVQLVNDQGVPIHIERLLVF